jgi:SAM-dependent methyltransferase
VAVDTPMPANESLQQVADLFSQPAVVEEMNERLQLGLREWEAGVVDRFLPATGRILDLGCGAGREAIALARLGYEVVAADMSTEQLGRAKANAAEAGVTVQWALVDGLTVPTGPFDAIVMWAQVIGNMQQRGDQLALLQRCHEALRPGGVTSASGHYRDFCCREWGDQTEGHWFYPTGSWEPGALKYWMFTRETLTELVEEAGFEALATEVPDSLKAIVHVVGRRPMG